MTFIKIVDIFNRIGVYLLCACIPGILFIINGIKIISSKETISIGTDSHWKWKIPVVIKGKSAEKDGRFTILFGAFLLLLGCVMIIGVLT